MVIYTNVVEELNSGLPRTNLGSRRVEDLNQGPPDFKSSALNHSATLLPFLSLGGLSVYAISGHCGLGCLCTSVIDQASVDCMFCTCLIIRCGGHRGLMVSALDFGAIGPGLCPAWGHCVVFLGKTLSSHSA